MAYKDFIEKFVESSSLSEKDSMLLSLEMESDFYAKEKDLILNNETDPMKKIENDFGDKNKLAEQMFLAHHRYLDIPILGPLLYFKSARIFLILLSVLPLNIFTAFSLGTISTEFISNFTTNQSSAYIYFLRFLPGLVIPYIPLAYIFSKRRLETKVIKKGSLIFFMFITLFLIFTFLQAYFLEESFNLQEGPVVAILQLLWLLLIVFLCLSFLNLLTILITKILKWKK